jgi:purine nucleoside permease
MSHSVRLFLKLFLGLTLLVSGFGAAIAADNDEPIQIKMVIVTMFEIGEDEGDAPGEFQLWKERMDLDTQIPFPHSHHDIFMNEERGILGIVTGMGSIKSATAVMALGLDPRFDLSKAYWLVAGIAGIDPEDASVGSAAWAKYLVDGDLAHEIDAREIPDEWTTGYFPYQGNTPYDPNMPENKGEMFVLNASLVDWAFSKTKDIDLGDDEAIQKHRSEYEGYPNAQKPPFVLIGDQLAAMTFWHGELMNDWANQWTRYWTEGKGEFVTSAMEDTGSFQSITYLHESGKVDKNRFMVLRTGSNYTMPPKGVTAADNFLHIDHGGYAGLTIALESAYKVGSVIVNEIVDNWPNYENSVP